MTTIRNRRWKYYNEFGYDENEDLAKGMLNNVIIADIKDAERVGTGPPLSSYSQIQLQEELLDLELTLNKDHVDDLRSLGQFKEAAELEREIREVESMRGLK